MATANLARGSAVTVDGKIYTMGWDGGGSNFMSMDIAMVYDPQAETWTNLPSLPQGPRSLLAACAAGGKIYAGGGYASGTILPYVEEYDPAANRWTVKSNLGTGRVDLTCAESGGKVYFMQGDRGGEGNSNALEEYNPALDP